MEFYSDFIYYFTQTSYIYTYIYIIYVYIICITYLYNIQTQWNFTQTLYVLFYSDTIYMIIYIKYLYSIHTMEFYSDFKRNDILTTWMKLENILLSEISCKRTNTKWFCAHEIRTVVKFIDTESKLVVARGWERGQLGLS